MAKRKRKAPKRKRNVVKRKAPKRKRRNRFGKSVLERVLGFDPDEEMKKALMAPIGAALEEAGKTEGFKTKLEEATSKLGDKKEAVKTAANSIKEALEEDMKNGKTELTGTKAAINQTGEEGATAFYKMIDASGIKDKMGGVIDKAKAKITEKAKTIFEQAGKKNPLVKASIPQAKVLLQKFMEKITPEYIGKEIHTKYSKTTDMSKKIFFHILSKISFTGFQENKKKLLEEAGGAVAAGGQATVDAAKKAAAEAAKKKAEAAKKKDTTTTPAKDPKTKFGKRKRGPSASLKRMCKKHGVRLMVKRGKKRVYKSSKVLKEQCQRKLKKNKKKNFGRKKIKRSGIMPPRKRKTRGKKRRKQKGGAAKLAQILKASARRQAKRAGRGARSAAKRARRRARSAARYVKRNPRRTAGYTAGGLAGLGALGLGGLEARRAMQRYRREKKRRPMGISERAANPGLFPLQKDDPYASPTGRFVRGVKKYPYRRRSLRRSNNIPLRRESRRFLPRCKSSSKKSLRRSKIKSNFRL